MKLSPRLKVALFAAALLPTTAGAQSYPDKPLRFIVPYPAGGATDVVSRVVSDSLSKALGQPVIVENISGAGGAIGTTAIAAAKPDGYTIGLGTTGTYSVSPHLYAGKIGYDALKGFTPISPVVSYVNVLVSNGKVPVRTVSELVAYAKDNPNKVTYGSSGNGATNHLSGVLLTKLTGAPMVHVPYRGGALALADVVGGHVTAMFDLLVTSVPHIKEGRLNALAVTSAKRSRFLPDVPTMDEADVDGYAAAGSDLWFGVLGPANMPADITNRLNDEITKILNTPAVQERFEQLYLDVVTGTPTEFRTMLIEDHEKWGAVVEAAGAALD